MLCRAMCEMFCFPMLKQPVYTLQGDCAAGLMFALSSASDFGGNWMLFPLGSSLMVAHSPMEFEFSVEMGIFQTVFLGL